MTGGLAAAAAPRSVWHRPRRARVRATWRLVRLEARRSLMAWLVPLAVALFWFNAYRQIVALPPLWNVRVMAMQHDVLLDFAAPVVGAAAWVGSREGRHGVTEVLAATAHPRWTRHLAAWAAVAGWALTAYLGCVGVLYAVTAHQGARGGPLWWPAAVGAAGVPALAAVGFAAGALVPSRFTTPLITIAAFLGLGLSTSAAHTDGSYALISPLLAGSGDLGPSPAVATFYPYLRDLPIAQVMFMVGLTLTALALPGLSRHSAGPWLRRVAAGLVVLGVTAAGTAVALAGTARLDTHGLMVIPRLHDPGQDQAVSYLPTCSQGAVPVCLHPAYTTYLPVVTSALQPILDQVDGLPGAPSRISQSAATFHPEPAQGVRVEAGGSSGDAHDPVIHLVLPGLLPSQRVNGAVLTDADLAAQVRSEYGYPILATVVGSGAGQAQRAVIAGMLLAASVPVPGPEPVGPRPGGDRGASPRTGGPAPAVRDLTPEAYAAARRFAALSATVRHAWLVQHLAALRAGRVGLTQLP